MLNLQIEFWKVSYKVLFGKGTTYYSLHLEQLLLSEKRLWSIKALYQGAVVIPDDFDNY